MEIRSLLDFLRKPRYEIDPDPSLSTLGILLLWTLAISLFLAMLLGIISHVGPWNLEEHALDELFETYSTVTIFFLGCVLAPVFEEFIFRGPMWFFRNSTYFPWIFYGLTLAFALVHLSNYPNILEIWPLAPLLISPQLNIGIFLGFIRIRYGLLWSVLFHAVYNSVVLGPILLLHELGISFS